MVWTVDSALEDKLITVVERDDDLGVYRFQVGDLSTIITVEVRRLPNDNRGTFRRSHDIKTPGSVSQHRHSHRPWDDVPYALHQAVDTITSWYRAAVAEGKAPEESWLIKV